MKIPFQEFLSENQIKILSYLLKIKDEFLVEAKILKEGGKNAPQIPYFRTRAEVRQSLRFLGINNDEFYKILGIEDAINLKD